MRLKKFILMLTGALCLVSCSKSDSEPDAPLELTLEKITATITEGETIIVKIESGNGGYSISSYSPEIIAVQIKSNSISIIGNKPGETTLEIKDAKGKTASVKVTVIAGELTLDKYTLTVNIGESATVEIKKGNGGYTLSGHSTAIATAKLSGTTITVEGVKKGETTVVVKDRLDNEVSLVVNVVNTPTHSNVPRFVWGDISLELEKSNGWGTAIFSEKVAMTNIADRKQYIVKWSGDMSVGDKSGASIVVVSQTAVLQTINLSGLSVVKVENERYWIALTKDDDSGELVFTR